jgi:hypothetical protein
MMTSVPAGGRPERRAPNYAAWVNVVLGIVVFLLRFDSPRPSFEVHRNLFLTGILISFAALAAVIAHDGRSTHNYWSAVDLAAGAWLLISVAVFPSPSALVMQGQVVLGVLIILVALAALMLEITAKRRGA